MKRILTGRLFLSDLLVIAILIGLSYSNIFSNGYVWDDHYQIENNPYVSEIAKLPDLFTHDYWQLFAPNSGAVGYWRPLYPASFYVDFLLPFSRPLAHHIVDLFIYLACCVSVLVFLREFIPDRLTSSIAAACFTLWPLHTEAVTSMAGRLFSFCTVLWIGSFLVFRGYWARGQRQFLILSGFLFSMALLCHELSIVFPIFVFGLCWFDWKRVDEHLRKNRFTNTLILFAFITLTYFVLRKMVAPVRIYGTEELSWGLLRQVGSTTLRTLRGMIWPYYFTLIEDPPALFSTRSDGPLGILLLSGWLAWAFISLKRRTIWSHCAVWSLVPLILVISPWPRGSVYQDRYTFIPSVATSLALGLLLWKIRLSHPKRLVGLSYILAICWLMSFIPTTLSRNLDWRTDQTLWCREARTYPLSFQGNRNCAWALKEEGRYSEALLFYDKALSLRVDSTAANDYATVLGYLGRCNEAVGIFRRLRQKEPTFLKAWRNEASCLEILGHALQAKKVFAEALLINPGIKSEDIIKRE